MPTKINLPSCPSDSRALFYFGFISDTFTCSYCGPRAIATAMLYLQGQKLVVDENTEHSLCSQGRDLLSQDCQSKGKMQQKHQSYYYGWVASILKLMSVLAALWNEADFFFRWAQKTLHRPPAAFFCPLLCWSLPGAFTDAASWSWQLRALVW